MDLKPRRIYVSARGCCHGCGVLGPPDRMTNFLCGDCANPEKIIHVCARCHARIELRPGSETIRTLQAYCPALPDHPGITIVAETCDACRHTVYEALGNVEFYVLQPSEHH